jgi:hypothetical protein
LPVLRGFSRNAKQDSEANAVSGGVNEANVAPPKGAGRASAFPFNPRFHRGFEKKQIFLSKKRDIFAQIRSRPRALSQGVRAAEF